MVNYGKSCERIAFKLLPLFESLLWIVEKKKKFYLERMMILLILFHQNVDYLPNLFIISFKKF